MYLYIRVDKAALETANILSLLIFHVTILQHSEEQEISEEKYE